MFSAITDRQFAQITAGFNGLSRRAELGQFLKLLNPADGSDRAIARRMGFIYDSAAQSGASQARYLGDTISPELARRVGDVVLRASGLNGWTDMGRFAFQMTFLGTLADNAGRSMDQLEDALSNSLRRYGISPAEWDTIRTTKLYEPEKGVKFLRAHELYQRSDLTNKQRIDLATKIMHMVQAETNFAVPTVSLRARATLGGSLRPGTFMGEVQRSGFMFKNFALTIIYTHLRRFLDLESFGVSQIAYGSNLVIGTAIMGAIAISMKDIAAGKKPEFDNMLLQGEQKNAAQFWLRALAQGGGLGIFGDFIFSDVNRYGSNIQTTLLGPVFALADDLVGLTYGNIQNLAKGEDTKFWSEMARMLRYVPGSNLWYTGLLYQRGLVEQLQKLADPNAARRFRRLIKRRDKQTTSGRFFFEPGKSPFEAAQELIR